MSRGPETRFIASVHRLLPDDLYHMKNHNTYIGGPADVWYSGKMGDAWIEYKFIEKLPPITDMMDTRKPYALSSLQQEWLRERHTEGRRVFVVLGFKDGGIVFKQRRWEEKFYRDAPKKPEILTRKEIAHWISMLVKGSYEAPVRRRKGIERVV